MTLSRWRIHAGGIAPPSPREGDKIFLNVSENKPSVRKLIFILWCSRKRFWHYTERIDAAASGGLRPQILCPLHSRWVHILQTPALPHPQCELLDPPLLWETSKVVATSPTAVVSCSSCGETIAVDASRPGAHGQPMKKCLPPRLQYGQTHKNVACLDPLQTDSWLRPPAPPTAHLVTGTRAGAVHAVGCHLRQARHVSLPAVDGGSRRSC